MDDWLSRCADDESIPQYTSQRGEDRVLQKLFEKIGIRHNWCVEFGATDGKHRSNTWYWINKQNWSSVQIEAARDYHLNLRTRSRESFDALRERYHNNSRVICLNRWVGTDKDNSLDTLLATTPIPRTFDLLSLDVDGNEYAIWSSLKSFLPRVIVVEHNKTIPIEKNFYSDRGSSLRGLAELGKRKGYELVAANDLNGVFVQREEFGKLGIGNNSVENIWKGHEKYRMYIEEHDRGALSFYGEDRVRWVRGVDGTLRGQVRAGYYVWIPSDQETLPSVQLSQPKRYASGLIRHWLHSLSV